MKNRPPMRQLFSFCYSAVILLSAAGSSAQTRPGGQSGYSVTSKTNSVSSVQKSVVSIFSYSGRDRDSNVRIGTGFIYHKNGYVVTLESVVGNSENIYVRFTDNTVTPGEIIPVESKYGLVLIKIEGSGYPEVKKGSSARLDRTSILTVIGNSLGVFPSITLASYLGREQNGFLDLGAIIPPGNCGSPVFDQKGRITGAIMGRVLQDSPADVTRGKIGIAVPIELIRHEMDDVITYHNSRRGWIGMTVEDIEGSDYIRIIDLIEGGPSEQAGLAAGDTIVFFEGRKLKGVSDLRERVIRNPPGSKVTFTLKKGDMHISHLIRVDEKAPRPRQRLPR